MQNRFSRVADGLAYGVELTVRSSLASLFLGLRWSGLGRQDDRAGIPSPSWDLPLLSKVLLDEVFFASELISAPVVSRDEASQVAREIAEALVLYEERGWLADPASYHLDPPALDLAKLGDRDNWVDHQHLQFRSGFEPHAYEPGRERWLSHEANHMAHAWLLEHPGAPRPWLVCIPGYRMGRVAVDFTGFQTRWLHRQLGLNIAIPVLPLHGPRRVGRRDGDGFFTGNFIDTIHAQTQAIWDVRRLIGWLRDSRGAPAIGAYGVSLGGYSAALVASLEDNIDCVVAGIPAADFARLLRGHAPKIVRAAATMIGLSFDRIERVLRVISPLALPPKVPHERRFLYAGLVDRLASPDHARDLWNHWGQPRIAWYQGSHVSFLWEREVRELLQEAMRLSGFLGPRSTKTGRSRFSSAGVR